MNTLDVVALAFDLAFGALLTLAVFCVLTGRFVRGILNFAGAILSGAVLAGLYLFGALDEESAIQGVAMGAGLGILLSFATSLFSRRKKD